MKKKTTFLMQLTEADSDDGDKDVILPTLSQHKSSDTAMLLLDLWTLRNQNPGHDLGFDDETSWNILLDLYVSQSNSRSVVSSDLAFSYFVPKSTLGRYVDFLEEKGLLNKSRDPHNRVRILLSLTNKGNQMLGEILGKMASTLRIL